MDHIFVTNDNKLITASAKEGINLTRVRIRKSVSNRESFGGIGDFIVLDKNQASTSQMIYSEALTFTY